MMSVFMVTGKCCSISTSVTSISLMGGSVIIIRQESILKSY